MPELPAVETTKRYFHKYALNRKVEEFVRNEKDDKVFIDPAPNAKINEEGLLTCASKCLNGHTLVDTGRKGKTFWLCFKLDTEETSYLVIHLGMTGKVLVERKGGLEGEVVEKLDYQSNSKISLDTERRHWKFHLTFGSNEAEDWVKFTLVDIRRMARIKWMKELTLPLLGYDPLLDWPASFDTFKNCLIGKNTSIKAVLLDQTIFAGIGNWIADGTRTS